MATQLAIGYLASRPLLPGNGAPLRSAHVTEHDSISSRPPIPQAVVSWPDPVVADDGLPLPVGAGDPATGIDGPPSFRRIGHEGAPRRDLDGVLLGAVGVLLMVLAVAVAWQLDRPATTWVARDEAPAPFGLMGRVPVVELRILCFEPVARPASAEEGVIALSSTAKPALSTAN